MEENTEQQSHSHFPEDADAPHVNQSFFKRFGESFKSPVDYLLFGVIFLFTLATVSFSLYIIVVKYL